MRRALTLTAVLGSAGIAGALLTGIAAAATTTTTTPVTLCASTLLRSVSVPGPSGSCPSGSQTVKVGSASDVAALASRLDRAEASITANGSAEASDAAAIAALSSRLDSDDGLITDLRQRLRKDEADISDLDQAAYASGALVGPKIQLSIYKPWTTTAEYWVSINAVGLTPGSTVTVANTSGEVLTTAVVNDEGAVGVRVDDNRCPAPLIARGFSDDGPVTSNTLDDCG